ncbi:2-hydroxy-3-oxopropionate reductase [Anaeromyxobacter oryzae]|uniref:2-hydroxy-3-oxopropionate reductase n=1 Tax=Anaeromyxobacter oryzae TaxID=2918170 RepID=A0ABM7X196_9BACT|nr:2-hydroxy-3-oxopropionate reductase [Anaeromyxobacter oryzae]BDG05505.1 2-hydroxy-3-oxopropionate reductase [Anaeromyxobacter oryzae]
MSEIGFVGLGVMGRPMAANLLKGGHTLWLHSRSGVPDDLTHSGGRACRSGREVASHAEVVFTMLPDTPDVEKALFGADGIAEGLAAGKLLVDMSSISPDATRDFAARLAERGCLYVDAPVSGGDVGARSATLTIMVGATDEGFARVKPLLDLLGKNVTHVGANGAGQTCKVANQIAVGLGIAAVAEALLFASKSGADPAKVRQALLGGFASSRILEVHGERMIARRFEPGARIELHQKDLELALSSARRMGLALPGTALVQQLFNACRANGGARWDHSALVKALELLGDHELGGGKVVPTGQ